MRWKLITSRLFTGLTQSRRRDGSFPVSCVSKSAGAHRILSVEGRGREVRQIVARWGLVWTQADEEGVDGAPALP